MSAPGKYKFRLYTAEGTANSSLAFGNLLSLCRTHLADRFEIEVVDVFAQPQRALSESIRMTPTLVKLSPSPRRTIVGTLSQTERVLAALDIERDSSLLPQA